MKPMSYTEQMQGSLFSWETSWHLYHAMNECQVANVHGQASDAYVYVWMMQGSLFSWITLKLVSHTEQMQGRLFSWETSWHLYHAMNECQVANVHGQASDA